jgi:hypothetical protein
LWVIFALLDPDPDSTSTDPIESGSNWATLYKWNERIIGAKKNILELFWKEAKY